MPDAVPNPFGDHQLRLTRHGGGVVVAEDGDRRFERIALRLAALAQLAVGTATAGRQQDMSSPQIEADAMAFSRDSLLMARSVEVRP